jgi:sorting nexin-25
MSPVVSILTTWQAVVLVGGIAVVTPLLSRLLSPLLLILLSPVIALLLLTSFIAANVFISFALDQARERTKGDMRLSTSAQPFAFSTPAAWQAVLTRSQWSYTSPHSLPPLVPNSLHVSAMLNEILILVVRDFVLSWYMKVSPSPSFPASISTTLRASVHSLLTRLDQLDLPLLVVRRVLPKINQHVDHFRESEMALRGVGLERRLTQSDELDLLLASRYAARGGKLHPAVDNLSSMITTHSEEAHLRKLMDRALPIILPPSEGGSRATHIAAREILTCVILVPIMEMLADPDFWNRMIDQFVSMLNLYCILRFMVLISVSSSGRCCNPSAVGEHDYFPSFLLTDMESMNKGTLSPKYVISWSRNLGPQVVSLGNNYPGLRKAIPRMGPGWRT